MQDREWWRSRAADVAGPSVRIALLASGSRYTTIRLDCQSGSFAEVAPRSRSQLTTLSCRVPRELAASSGVPSAYSGIQLRSALARVGTPTRLSHQPDPYAHACRRLRDSAAARAHAA